MPFDLPINEEVVRSILATHYREGKSRGIAVMNAQPSVVGSPLAHLIAQFRRMKYPKVAVIVILRLL
jgi:hypothetical protein